MPDCWDTPSEEDIVVLTELDSQSVGEFVDFVHFGRLPAQDQESTDDDSRNNLHDTFAAFGVELSDFVFDQIPIEDTENERGTSVSLLFKTIAEISQKRYFLIFMVKGALFTFSEHRNFKNLITMLSSSCCCLVIHPL